MQVNLTSIYKFFAMNDERGQNAAVPGSSKEVACWQCTLSPGYKNT